MPKNRKHKPRTTRLVNALIGQIQAEQECNLTSNSVADMLGVQPATISRWINGKTNLDQLECLMKLIDKLPKDRWVSEISKYSANAGK